MIDLLNARSTQIGQKIYIYRKNDAQAKKII